MSDEANPSDLADKFMLRLPMGMRAAIAEEARRNRRSMNAEIIAHLQGKFAVPGQGEPALSRTHALLEEQCGLLRDILVAIKSGPAA